MKRKTSPIFLIIFFCTSSLYAQMDGDYRTNFVGTSASWANTSIWEKYDGISGTWVPAGAFPTSTDNVITISTGDSVQITAGTSITIDQLVIASGSSLLIFATPGTQTVTLNNGAGDDISVDGRFYIASGGLLTTATGASIRVNSDGYMQIRNGGESGVNIYNYGRLEMNRFTITNSLVQNFNVMAFIDANPVAALTASLDNATLINSDTFLVQTTSNIFFQGIAGVNTVTNDASGVLIKTSNSGTFGTVNSGSGVNFSNAGRIEGLGSFLFDQSVSTFTNTGTVSPGTASGTSVMTTNNSVLKPSGTLSIQIGTSNTPGTGHDQVAISSLGVTTLAGTLTVTELSPTAPLGVYTIMTTAGTFAGNFSTVNKPSNYGVPTVTGNTVQIEKLSATLPVRWSSFTATRTNENEVKLAWSTEQELNTSHFLVEHSIDGQSFTGIGNVAAKGSSSVKEDYIFTHTSPNSKVTNYYRVKQFDQDGAFTYSKISKVRFNSKDARVVEVLGNPVKNSLKLRVTDTDISLTIVQLNGGVLSRHNVQPGVHQINVQDLPRGVYQLVIYQGNKRVDSKKFIVTK